MLVALFSQLGYPPAWLSFIIVIFAILVFSKQDLSLVLFLGTLTFSWLAQVPVFPTILTTLADIPTHLLAIIMFLIPILGGLMEESKLMLEAVEKMAVPKKVALMVTPALFGLLPVAGGALMSAPIIDQIGPTVEPVRKIAINVWFRHLLVFIYPLSAVILVCTKIAGLNQYITIFYLIPPFIVMAIVGWLTLIRPLSLEDEAHERDLGRVFRNLTPVLLAPALDMVSRYLFDFAYPEIVTIIALTASIGLVLILAKQPPKAVWGLFSKMKIWRFPLLIYAIFYFLNTFTASGVTDEIGQLNLPFAVFLAIGFFLGIATGRNQMPFSLMIPIYLVQNNLAVMPMFDFIFLDIAIFLGYLLTPIHPCLAYSIKFFNEDYRRSFKAMAVPTGICLALLYLTYAISLLFIR